MIDCKNFVNVAMYPQCNNKNMHKRRKKEQSRGFFVNLRMLFCPKKMWPFLVETPSSIMLRGIIVRDVHVWVQKNNTASHSEVMGQVESGQFTETWPFICALILVLE
jgi:hypothetical protein